MVIRFGQIELDEQRFLLQRDGVRLRLRPKVFDLLVHLVRHRARVVLREELVMALWGTTAVGPGSLSGLVNELRHVLGEAGRGPSSIRTVHARGYQFVAEVEPRDVGNSLPEDRDQGEATGADLGRFGAARVTVSLSFARVASEGARAVIVAAQPGSSRSTLLREASRDLARAGFEIHRLGANPRADAHPSSFVDCLIDGLVERYGIEVIRSLIPARARELLKRMGGTRSNASVRPRDALASRQYDERILRGAAELLGELAEKRPLALVLGDHEQTESTISRALLPLLRLLGSARVFVICAADVADGDLPIEMSEAPERRIEWVKLPPLDRSQLNEMLESRGVAALPTVLADALMAHVRADEASLEFVAGWLEAEGSRNESGADEPMPPNIERRMKRVEPDTQSRRSRYGTG